MIHVNQGRDKTLSFLIHNPIKKWKLKPSISTDGYRSTIRLTFVYLHNGLSLCPVQSLSLPRY
ncbi:hypothetical protein CPXV_GER1998_2_210 [Cowpox virus]|uniref:Uncharacterized protein n=1 Tax=Cowpox virus TaxID=10243 RepID=G0XW72_COWPX|nr:hypothetical protein CPXV_GER1998_2_210 [Cowpox virus]